VICIAKAIRNVNDFARVERLLKLSGVAPGLETTSSPQKPQGSRNATNRQIECRYCRREFRPDAGRCDRALSQTAKSEYFCKTALR
jgi:hypothetical protein